MSVVEEEDVFLLWMTKFVRPDMGQSCLPVWLELFRLAFESTCYTYIRAIFVTFD